MIGIQDKKRILQRRTKGQRVVFVIVFVIFALYAVSLIYPFVWAFLNSLRDKLAFFEKPFGFSSPSFENYVRAFSQFKIGKTTFIGMFFNSIIHTGLTTLLAIMGSACTAYVLAKYKFRGSGLIYAAAVFIMIIPSIGSVPAMYSMLTKAKLTDNLIVTSVMMGGCFGLYFMMLYGTFQSVSWTYAEAGFVDGANDFTIFFRIMLPQIAGPLLALSLVCAITVWNEYLTPFIFMRKIPTLATGLYLFQEKALAPSFNDFPLFLCGILMTALPVVVIFICFQNTIMNNTSVGGIKG